MRYKTVPLLGFVLLAVACGGTQQPTPASNDESGNLQWHQHETLQVHHSADPEVIEAAYRRLARMYHPDVNPDPAAAKYMLEINLAYELLGDSVKRAQYDRSRKGQSAPFGQRRQEPSSSEAPPKQEQTEGRRCANCGSTLGIEVSFCKACGASRRASAATPQGMVSFWAAVKLGFQRYFDFNGRATRAEFWWWWLFFVVIHIPLEALPDGVSWILDPFILIPTLALGARRLHDTNRSVRWLLPVAIGGLFLLYTPQVGVPEDYPSDVYLILIMGGYVLIFISMLVGTAGMFVFAIKRGDNGPNKYGPDPRHPASR